jgi:hypothetical protein
VDLGTGVTTALEPEGTSVVAAASLSPHSCAKGATYAPDRVFLLCAGRTGGALGREGEWVKLLAPALEAVDAATGRRLWRRELVPAPQAGGEYCLVSWIERAGGCLVVTVAPGNGIGPARAIVVDEEDGAACELAAPLYDGHPDCLPAPRWIDRASDARPCGAQAGRLPGQAGSLSRNRAATCRMPAVLNGRAILETDEAVILMRGRL